MFKPLICRIFGHKFYYSHFHQTGIEKHVGLFGSVSFPKGYDVREDTTFCIRCGLERSSTGLDHMNERDLIFKSSLAPLFEVKNTGKFFKINWDFGDKVKDEDIIKIEKDGLKLFASASGNWVEKVGYFVSDPVKNTYVETLKHMDGDRDCFKPKITCKLISENQFSKYKNLKYLSPDFLLLLKN
jgi:hypothetical protein